jgi:aspartyl-tRNA(Asn)/glutamyl-tRNA(Gln) amidotransferase subunit C
MADLTADEVTRVASLARLNLSEREVEEVTADLGKILDYVAMLQAVETGSVQPLSQVVAGETPTRDDEPRESLSQEDALQAAPESSQGFFVVPRILEGG